MSVTYNLGNAIGQSRLYGKDNDVTNAFFTDEEISVFLSNVGSVVYLAAAHMLRIKACAPENLSKKFKIGSYSEDTSNTSESLLALAKSYEELAADAGIGVDGEALAQEAIAEIAYDVNNYNEILRKKALRGKL